MAQIVSEQPLTLENSVGLTRPDAKLFTQPDTNSGRTDISQYSFSRSQTQLNLPTSSGPTNYKVSCCDRNVNSRGHAKSAFPSKKKIEMSVLDPITGFLSPAGENLLRVQHRMPSFGNSRLVPQNIVPQSINSIRTQPESIDELKRTQEGIQEPSIKWDSRKVSEETLKSRLGGWTSLYDPRSLNQTSSNDTHYRLKDIFPNMKIASGNEEERDKLAKVYRFTTSAQEMYKQVNWDAKLPKKLHRPVTTYENGKADPLKRSEPTEVTPELAKILNGSTWDRSQYRNSHFTREPVAFTAPTKRANQIPGYSGCLSGINMDDVIEKYTPLSVLRTRQPKETNPNYSPNIPGYTGKYHYTKTTGVSHYDNSGRPFTTTAAFHRPLNNLDDDSERKIIGLAGDFARIQTKVAPQNPYDNVNRVTDKEVNNSMDHIKQPIVNLKGTAYQDYMVKNRENEIKSILKKSAENAE